MEENECYDCGNEDTQDEYCVKSEKDCKHHCNCSWVFDVCCYCEVEFGEVE